MTGAKSIRPPNAKPPRLHRLAGTFRPDRHAGATAPVLTMRQAQARVRAPKSLTVGLATAGLEFVKDAYARFDGWTAPELALLRRAAEQLDVAASCHHHVVTTGLYVQTARGTVPNPMLRTGRQATATFAALCRQLHLDTDGGDVA